MFVLLVSLVETVYVCTIGNTGRNNCGRERTKNTKEILVLSISY
jgi:hypothetical protein